MTKTSSILLSLIACATMQAQLTWNGGTGDWGAGGNWTPSGPPTSGDHVVIDATGSVLNIITPSEAGQIHLGGSGTDVITLNINAKLTYLDRFDRRDWGADGDTIAVNINNGGTINGSGGKAAQASRIGGYNTITVNTGGTLTNIYRMRFGTNIVLNGGTFRLSGSETNGNGPFGLNSGASISGSSGTLIFPASGANAITQYTYFGTSAGSTLDLDQLTLVIDVAEGYTPKVGDTFDLSNANATVMDLGDGSNIATKSADGNWEFVWDLSQWNQPAGKGVITLDDVTWIPEPSTYAALAGVAVLAFSLMRRRC